MMAMRNAGIPVCAATVMAIGPINAAEAMLPGPIPAEYAGQKKEHHRDERQAASAGSHGTMCDLIEGAVHLRLREQQRDADERQKQRRRKPAGNFGEGLSRQRQPEDPRQGHRKDPDVDLRSATERDGDCEGQEGNDGKIHSELESESPEFRI